VSTPPPSTEAAVPPAYWRGWAEIRADLRTSVLLVSGVGLCGIPAGVLWWLLAPRLDFRITAAGPVPVDAVPNEELLIADDGVFLLLVTAIGLVVGVLAWRLRRRRGVAMLLAIAVGTAICAALAWQVGAYLGSGPSHAQLTHVGGRVTTALTLGSLPALAFAPFAAVLAYLVAVLYTRSDDLGRTEIPRRAAPEPTTDRAVGGELPVS
jgi:Protein of unknown function (DUF2567)